MNFRIDLMALPLPIRKARFREIQYLAFSKGIQWASGRCNPYPVSRLAENEENRLFCITTEWTTRPSMYFSDFSDKPIIDYKSAIKQLREYTNEKRTPDEGTVQNPYAQTTATSYTFSPSIIRTTTGGWTRL